MDEHLAGRALLRRRPPQPRRHRALRLHACGGGGRLRPWRLSGGQRLAGPRRRRSRAMCRWTPEPRAVLAAKSRGGFTRSLARGQSSSASRRRRGRRPPAATTPTPMATQPMVETPCLPVRRPAALGQLRPVERAGQAEPDPGLPCRRSRAPRRWRSGSSPPARLRSVEVTGKPGPRLFAAAAERHPEPGAGEGASPGWAMPHRPG